MVHCEVRRGTHEFEATSPAVNSMKTYYRLMLGQGSAFAAECFANSYVGADYGIHQDLTRHLPEEWSEFNSHFIPIYLQKHPHKSKVAAGLACGFLWTISKGMKRGDIVICPDGSNRYQVGEISGEYFYSPGDNLPHRRPVRWLQAAIDRSEMSLGLKRSTNSTGTVVNLSRSGHADEIERFVAGAALPLLLATDPSIEDPSSFALETHLEDFLVTNWANTELGKHFDIYEEMGSRLANNTTQIPGPSTFSQSARTEKSCSSSNSRRGEQVTSSLGRRSGIWAMSLKSWLNRDRQCEELSLPWRTIREFAARLR